MSPKKSSSLEGENVFEFLGNDPNIVVQIRCSIKNSLNTMLTILYEYKLLNIISVQLSETTNDNKSLVLYNVNVRIYDSKVNDVKQHVRSLLFWFADEIK